MDKRDAPIASPCGLDWRTMTPADGGRFCASCKKVVRDLSSLTEREARSLLALPRNEGLCVRYVHDEQGRLFFTDRPAPLVSATLLSRAKRAAATAALATTPLALSGCSTEPQYMESMGDVAWAGPAPAAGVISDEAGPVAQGDAGDSGARRASSHTPDAAHDEADAAADLDGGAAVDGEAESSDDSGNSPF